MAVRSSLGSKTLACIALGTLAAFSISCSAETPSIDPAKATITLERSACLGSCPDYKVRIHGDGRVQFSTETAPIDQVDALHRQFSHSDGVLLPGTHEDRVTPEAVGELIRQFQAAGFWGLKKEYLARITDCPAYRLTIDTGRQRKTVIDYVGVALWTRYLEGGNKTCSFAGAFVSDDGMFQVTKADQFATSPNGLCEYPDEISGLSESLGTLSG